jgi:uncharacterized protein YcfJ
MAEENKQPAKKINLRDRLGAKQGGAGAPAQRNSNPGGIPAPMIPGASGAIPQPTLSPGIPPPPFAPAAQPPRESKPPVQTVDPSDPYATVHATPAQVKPAEIKLDMSDAAHEAAKGMRKFIIVAGIAGALIGGLLGNVVGSGLEAKRVAAFSISGAGLLAADVEKSNAKIKELSDLIGEATKSIKEKKFPEKFASDLGGLNIPFDGEKLGGKGIGSYDAKTLKLLISYTSDVDALNDRKDALKSLFSGQKTRIVAALAAADKPTLGYTLIITRTPKGNAVGSLARILQPFPIEGDWPKEYKMNGDVPVTRYESGEPFSNKDKRIGIPIEPMSVNTEFPNDITGRILSEVIKTGDLLNGHAGQGEEEGKPGLIKDGEALVEALKKHSQRKP